MEIAQVCLLGIIALTLVILVWRRETTANVVAKLAPHLEDQFAKLESSTRSLSVQSSDLIRSQIGVMQSTSDSVANVAKSAAIIADSIDTQSRKLVTVVSELEQRCRDLSIQSERLSEGRDADFRTLSKQFKCESEERARTTEELARSLSARFDSMVAELRNKIVEDSLARDARLDELAKSIQSAAAASLLAIESRISAGEERRSERTEKLLAELKTSIEQLVKMTTQTLHSLEESVKF